MFRNIEFSPTSQHFKRKKLTGPNFVEWKRNVIIVLTTNGYKYILTEAYVRPGENPTLEMVQADLKWKKDDTMEKCYLLASISPVLQSQHEMMSHA